MTATLLRQLRARGQLEERANEFNLVDTERRGPENGLARLTLTIVEVLRQVLERQALRRVELGTLSGEEVERLGLAFIQINQMVKKISREFGVKPEELKATLGSLLQTRDKALEGTSLVDVIDKLLERRTLISGRVKIAVSNVDLIGLDLLAMLYPIYGEMPGWEDGQVSGCG